jgi:heptosyltransferase III
MRNAGETIVVFRVGSIGDTVVALPCFHAIRRAFPLAHITLLTNFPISAKAAPMLSVLGTESGFVDDVIRYPIQLRNPVEALRLLLRLRALKSSTLIYMRSNPTRGMIKRESLFFRGAGFRRILCVPINEDFRLPRVYGNNQEVETEASRLARCFASLGPIALNDPAYWDLRFTEAEIRAGDRLAASLPNPFLVIHTGGKETSKDWGFDRWVLFLRQFKQRSGVAGLAVVGAQDDYSRASSLVQVWGNGAVNLCGGPSPREVAALLAKAQLFIGHDSGPLHLTQCVRTPALGLFGSYNRPKQWHPIGSHVHVIHELRGMDAITVESVLQQALTILAGSQK